jgi:hypothetical protein
MKLENILKLNLKWRHTFREDREEGAGEEPSVKEEETPTYPYGQGPQPIIPSTLLNLPQYLNPPIDILVKGE